MRVVDSRLERGLIVRNSQGNTFGARLLHANREALVFETFGPECAVSVGEMVSEIAVLHDRERLYSGPAQVASVNSTGPTMMVTAVPVGEWFNQGSSASHVTLSQDAETLIRRWQTGCQIMPEYQLAVTSIRSFLSQLNEWLGPVDISMRSLAPQQRMEWSQQIAESVFAIVRPQMTDLFGRFERAAAKVTPDNLMIHRSFAQRELHPLILCGPLVYRSYTKPLGYAGDYEMVNMLLRNAMEGPSIYAMVINAYFLRMDIADGHRNRIEKLVDTLQRETRRVTAEDRPLRALNIGCGPVDELVRFIGREPLADRCEFTLVDFNAETLSYARQKIDAAKRSARRYPKVHFVHRSVNDLLKESSRTGFLESFGDQDLVYCAGLFDYLSDRICQRLLGAFYETVVTDGMVVATNVHPRHTAVATLSELAEWSLILRTEAEMKALVPSGAAELVAECEAAGTNVFVEFRRQSTAHDRTRQSTRRPITPLGGIPRV
jgi:extracellular factor (EF) 3-hydroxypalmitic acid methyl ester biosynthesis protein